VGEVASIILASIILTLLVDLPFQEAKKILWQKGKYCGRKVNTVAER
jgi:hypothetical protein